MFTKRQAADSLSRYPIPFKHPHEAAILAGIGPKIVRRLEERLRQHCQEFQLPMPEHPTAVAEHATTTLTNAEDAPTSSALSSNEITTSTDPASAPVPKRSRTQIPYVPRYRSGAYALLVALYELGIRDTGISKTVLIRHAQPHSQHSFVEPEVGTRYTAWSSMRTLLAKELIVAEGKPARYRLTDSGWQLAEQLVHAEVISQEADLATRIDTEGMPTTRRVRRSLRLSLTSSKSALNTQPDQPEHGAMQTPTGYGSTSLIEPMASPPHHYRWSALVQKSTALLAATPSKQSPARKFCYLLLNARDQPVNDPSRAEQLFDPETGIRRYRILYTQANATHPTARLVFRPMPAPNQPDHIVGYLEEGICLAHITRDLDRLPTRPVLSPIQNTLSTTKQTASTDEWTLPPHTFDIILLLDSREMTKRSDRTFIQRELEQRGIQVETRNLELGDVLWVARSKDRRLGGELILDVIIERKCMSDLVASIKDGRYYEQKSRLKRSGIERIVYLVEGQLDRGVRDMDPSSIESALAAIQVVDRFFLKRTRNVRESIDYFVNMTEFLRLQYQSKQLCSFTMQKTEGDDTAAIAARHQKNQCADARCRYLISFEDYAELCRKTVPQTVGTTMIRMLMSIHGISLEKASVLAERFPTPHSLISALIAAPDAATRRRLCICEDAHVPARRIGPKLSARIADYWYGETD